MTAQDLTQRALISTSNKHGIVELAQALVKRSIEILATGGTAGLLKTNNIPVTEVSDYTEFPEIMEGRVKTLHPKIHGGLLGRTGLDDEVMTLQNIPAIDYLIVNLYPFEETIQKIECSEGQAIEQIDIGGPTMLRSAAKNFSRVTVIIDPDDYPLILDELATHGGTSLNTRRKLAQKVFQTLANYNQSIANYFSQSTNTDLGETQAFTIHKKMDLRYGENPHQRAALYTNQNNASPSSLANSDLVQGKPLSYNNLLDTDCALRCVRDLDPTLPACVIIKHATPCGVGQATTLLQAYKNALSTDPQSAFGGIIAINESLDATTAEFILSQQFVEVIIAPGIAPQAKQLLQAKPNLRALVTGQPELGGATETAIPVNIQTISGGTLIQEQDTHNVSREDLKVVSKRQPTDAELQDLFFAWQIVKHVKSNAIVYAKNGITLGIGTGQTSRVFAAKIAALKAEEAGLDLTNSVLASDAFFPFADSIETAEKNGVTAIIQPGGSKRDSEVITAADNAGMAMVFTGIRHFRH
jgi:phosphoribosylaminoimidazolecarboxamide formyltransferase/IMP cyclohydrolase